MTKTALDYPRSECRRLWRKIYRYLKGETDPQRRASWLRDQAWLVVGCTARAERRVEQEPGEQLGPVNGSATPSGGSHFPLHGFSFASSEERQGAAVAHHLWPAFVAWMTKRGYSEWCDMDDSHTRELFECFVEGGWQEASQNDEAHRLPETKREQRGEGSEK